METFIGKLREQLQQTLPGQKVQARMSPLLDKDERFSERFRPGVRKGSVLILMYPDGNDIYVPLMVRSVYNGHHSGQISLPGGKQEAGDPDGIFTALRESQEELGIDPERVEVLGTLTELYIPPSNFQVLPVVGWSPQRPDFVPDPVEVASLVEVPLEHLLNNRNIRQTKRLLSGGFSFDTPCYFVQEQEVWGATAMILSEFLEIVRRTELMS